MEAVVGFRFKPCPDLCENQKIKMSFYYKMWSGTLKRSRIIIIRSSWIFLFEVLASLLCLFLCCCSVFSRYGIHSLPSILMINQTSRVHYHGPKDLLSLVQFYKKTSGKIPLYQITVDILSLLWNSFLPLFSFPPSHYPKTSKRLREKGRGWGGLRNCYSDYL